jgi:TPP-dependent pyruvate/acetoin dehydrogenase alpha subunit
VSAVHAQAADLVARARAGAGPGFLLANTYRYHGHHVGDVDRAYYRTKEEEELWRGERDPLELLARRLEEAGLATAEDLQRIAGDASAEIRAGLAFALEAPYPDPSEASEDVYA